MTTRSAFWNLLRPGALISALAAVAALGAAACSRSDRTDLSLLHVYYTADAIGYIEPCG